MLGYLACLVAGGGGAGRADGCWYQWWTGWCRVALTPPKKHKMYGSVRTSQEHREAPYAEDGERGWKREAWLVGLAALLMALAAAALGGYVLVHGRMEGERERAKARGIGGGSSSPRSGRAAILLHRDRPGDGGGGAFHLPEFERTEGLLSSVWWEDSEAVSHVRSSQFEGWG